MENVNDLLDTGSLLVLEPRVMEKTVRELLAEIGLLGKYFAILVDGKRAELDDVVARGGAWLEAPSFAHAVRRLCPILAGIHTPLAFTNGDYNPLNFMHDGERVTGWLDFTHACFEDPYVGLAKFIIWGFDRLGWGTGVQAGLVERFLYHQGVTRSDFAPRLALRCLYRLQRDTSVSGEQDRFYREEILKVLDTALDDLAQ